MACYWFERIRFAVSIINEQINRRALYLLPVHNIIKSNLITTSHGAIWFSWNFARIRINESPMNQHIFIAPVFISRSLALLSKRWTRMKMTGMILKAVFRNENEFSLFFFYFCYFSRRENWNSTDYSKILDIISAFNIHFCAAIKEFAEQKRLKLIKCFSV